MSRYPQNDLRKTTGSRKTKNPFQIVRATQAPAVNLAKDGTAMINHKTTGITAYMSAVIILSRALFFIDQRFQSSPCSCDVPFLTAANKLPQVPDAQKLCRQYYKLTCQKENPATFARISHKGNQEKNRSQHDLIKVPSEDQ